MFHEYLCLFLPHHEFRRSAKLCINFPSQYLLYLEDGGFDFGVAEQVPQPLGAEVAHSNILHQPSLNYKQTNLSCLVLSCLVLSCLVLSCLVLIIILINHALIIRKPTLSGPVPMSVLITVCVSVRSLSLSVTLSLLCLYVYVCVCLCPIQLKEILPVLSCLVRPCTFSILFCSVSY